MLKNEGNGSGLLFGSVQAQVPKIEVRMRRAISVGILVCGSVAFFCATATGRFAHAAGIFAVGVTNTHTTDQLSESDLRVSKLTELLP